MMLRKVYGSWRFVIDSEAESPEGTVDARIADPLATAKAEIGKAQAAVDAIIHESAPPLGMIAQYGSLVVRMHMKKFRDRNGVEYDLEIGPDGHPIVQSGASGKFFIVDWDELVALAVSRGINSTEGGW